MSDQENQFEVRPILSEEELDSITMPNGFTVREDGMIAVEIVYDGEIILFRSEEGDLMEMGVLCYLDHVVAVSARDYPDHPHVVSNIIQHLHAQYHAIAYKQRLAQMANALGPEALAQLASALGATSVEGMEGGGGLGGVFAIDSDGQIVEFDLEGPGEAVEDGNDGDNDDDEIIIG